MTSIPTHPAQQVLDSSKLCDYRSCPRYFFLRHILGWTADLPNVHLSFGSAWHKGMEVLLQNLDPSDRKGCYAGALSKALGAFSAEYQEHYPDPVSEETNAPKNLSNGRRCIELYARQYAADDFEVMFTELTGTAPLLDGTTIHCKVDAIVRHQGNLFAIDHKTTGSFSSKWLNQWPLSFQLHAYTHYARCYAGEEHLNDIMVNGACIRNSPQLKKNGEPYANNRDAEFLRIRITITDFMLDAWLWETDQLLWDLARDLDRLASCSENQLVLKAFPRNTGSCNNYGGCQFKDYCQVYTNPLHIGTEPPVGMKQEFWDPREMKGES